MWWWLLPPVGYWLERRYTRAQRALMMVNAAVRMRRTHHLVGTGQPST